MAGFLGQCRRACTRSPPRQPSRLFACAVDELQPDTSRISRYYERGSPPRDRSPAYGQRYDGGYGGGRGRGRGPPGRGGYGWGRGGYHGRGGGRGRSRSRSRSPSESPRRGMTGGRGRARSGSASPSGSYSTSGSSGGSMRIPCWAALLPTWGFKVRDCKERSFLGWRATHKTVRVCTLAHMRCAVNALRLQGLTTWLACCGASVHAARCARLSCTPVTRSA